MSKNLLTTDIRRTPRQQTATDLTRRAVTVTGTERTEMEMEICHWAHWTSLDLWSVTTAALISPGYQCGPLIGAKTELRLTYVVMLTYISY